MGLEFLLVLVLRFEVGVKDPLVINGDIYKTLDACLAQGNIAAQWLTQDFVTVEYRCIGRSPDGPR